MQHHISLKPYNTFAMDVRADYFVSVTNLIELQDALQFARENALAVLILGGGSNILLCGDFTGLAIKIDLMGIEVIAESKEEITLKIGAGENWHALVTHCVTLGYSGIENLALIPGTVGAAPMQNIGAYGIELQSVFSSLEALHRDNNALQTFSRADCQFGYRDSCFKQALKDQFIITSVTLTLSKKPTLQLHYAPLNTLLCQNDTIQTVYETVIKIRQEKLPDPKTLPNAGSFFKNPIIDRATRDRLHAAFPEMPIYTTDQTDRYKIPAAWLIDYCGFKGKRVGPAGVHEKQALVIINSGQASGEDILALASRIQKKIGDTFDIALEPEINIV